VSSIGQDEQAQNASRQLAEIRQFETMGDDERFIIASYRSQEAAGQRDTTMPPQK
jgi:hypothetical protein